MGKKYMQQNIGKQPYNSSNTDTSGWRNLDFYSNQVYPEVAPLLKKFTTILDVGCGNGRFNSLIKNDFDEITCIDSFEKINPIYDYDNVNFFMMDFMLPSLNKTFDVISFIGSFHPLYDSFGREMFASVKYLSHIGSKIIILDEWERNNFYPIDRIQYREEKIKVGDRTVVLVLERIL